ncbi:MAG: TonB family protein [Acidobacteriaceae bacterium]
MRRQVIQVEPEPFGPPAAGSLALHVGLVGLLALLMWVNGRFHGMEWGNNAPQGAIQANLVSSAPSIPLPQVTPPTPNVLATQLPSPSPAPPTKATIPIQQPDAIPLAERKPKLHHAEKPHEASPQHAQPTNQQDRARYGEAPAANLAHAMNQGARSNSPVAVTGGDFASRFPWYVDLITRKVSENWYTQEIDSATPYGSQVSVTFTIGRDGTVSNIHLSQPSTSPTLNGSATHAVQRVQSFGPLPSQYTGSSVSVEYTFTYDQPSR